MDRKWGEHSEPWVGPGKGIGITDVSRLLAEVQGCSTYFSGLQPHEITQISEISTVMGLREGDQIISKGDKASSVAVMLRGSASIIADGQHKLDVVPGDLLGDLAFFEREGERLADVECDEDNTLIACFPFVRMREFQRSSSEVSLKFMRILASSSAHKLVKAQDDRDDRETLLTTSRPSEREWMKLVKNAHLLKGGFRYGLGRELEDSELHVLGMKYLRLLRVEKGERVVTAHMRASALLFILTGSLHISVGGDENDPDNPPMVVASREPGEFVGEYAFTMGVLNEEFRFRSAHVQAAEDSVLGVLTFEALTALQVQDPMVAYKMYLALGQNVIARFQNKPELDDDNEDMDMAMPIKPKRNSFFDYMQDQYGGVVSTDSGTGEKEENSSNRQQRMSTVSHYSQLSRNSRYSQSSVVSLGFRRQETLFCEGHTSMSYEEAVKHLYSCQSYSDVWRGISHANIQILAKEMTLYHLEDGDFITRQGERSTFFAMIVSGSADVYFDSNKVGQLYAGDVLGGKAVFIRGKRDVDVECSASSNMVAVFESSMLPRLTAQNPALGLQLLRILMFTAVKHLKASMNNDRRTSKMRWDMLADAAIPQKVAFSIIEEAMRDSPLATHVGAITASAAMILANYLNLQKVQLEEPVIYTKGHQDRSMAFLLVGEAEAEIQGLIGRFKRKYKPGDLIGEEAFLREGLVREVYRRVDVKAKTYCIVGYLTHDKFRELNQRHPKFAHNLFRAITKMYFASGLCQVKMCRPRSGRSTMTSPSRPVSSRVSSARSRGSPTSSSHTRRASSARGSSPSSSRASSARKFLPKAKNKLKPHDTPLSMAIQTARKLQDQSLIVENQSTRSRFNLMRATTKNIGSDSRWKTVLMVDHLDSVMTEESNTNISNKANLGSSISPENHAPKITFPLDDLVELLTHCQQFSHTWRSFSSEEMAHFAEHMVVLRKKPGEMIVEGGDVKSHVIVLLKGDAAVVNEQGVKLSNITKGAIMEVVNFLAGWSNLTSIMAEAPPSGTSQHSAQEHHILIGALSVQKLVHMNQSDHKIGLKLVQVIVQEAIEKTYLLALEVSVKERQLQTNESDSAGQNITQLKGVEMLVDLHEKCGCFGADAVEDDILSLSESEISLIRLQPGDRIFRKNTVASSVLLIVKGTIDIVNGQKLIAKVHEGSYLGEEAMFVTSGVTGVRNADAVAATRLVLAVITYEKMHDIFVMFPELGTSMCLHMVGNLLKRLSGKPEEKKATIVPPSRVETPEEPRETEGTESSHSDTNSTSRREMPEEMKTVNRLLVTGAFYSLKMKTTSLLRKCQASSRFWGGFTIEQVMELGGWMQLIEAQPGEVIMKKGEKAVFAGIIVQSSLDIFDPNGNIVGHMRQGDIIGEFAVFNKDGLRGADVAAAQSDQPCVVAILVLDKLQALTKAHPSIGYTLLRVFATTAISKLKMIALMASPVETFEYTPMMTPELFHMILEARSAESTLSKVVRHEDIWLLAEKMCVVKVPAGKQIFKPGTVATCAMLVIQGEVLLIKGEVDSDAKQTIIQAGSFIGVSEFLRGALSTGPRVSEVRSRTDATLAVLRFDHFARLHEAAPLTAIQVYCKLGETVVQQTLEDAANMASQEQLLKLPPEFAKYYERDPNERKKSGRVLPGLILQS